MIMSSKIPVVDCILFCPKMISPKVRLKTSKATFEKSMNSSYLKCKLDFNAKSETNWASLSKVLYNGTDLQGRAITASTKHSCQKNVTLSLRYIKCYISSKNYIGACRLGPWVNFLCYAWSESMFMQFQK